MFLKKCAPPISGVKIKPTAELQTPNGPAPKMEEEEEEEDSFTCVSLLTHLVLVLNLRVIQIILVLKTARYVRENYLKTALTL